MCAARCLVGIENSSYLNPAQKIFPKPGYVVGIVLWLTSQNLFTAMVTKWPTLSAWQNPIRSSLGSLGALFFFLPAIGFIKHTNWGPDRQMVISTVIIAIGLGFSSLLDDSTWGTWSAYVQIAMLIATCAIMGFQGRQAKDQREPFPKA